MIRCWTRYAPASLKKNACWRAAFVRSRGPFSLRPLGSKFESDQGRFFLQAHPHGLVCVDISIFLPDALQQALAALVQDEPFVVIQFVGPRFLEIGALFRAGSPRPL